MARAPLCLSAAAFCALSVAPAAHAYQPPASCQALATIRMEQCNVWHVMRCDDQAPEDRVIVTVKDNVLTGVGVYKQGLAAIGMRKIENQVRYSRVFDAGDAYPGARSFTPGYVSASDYVLQFEWIKDGEPRGFAAKERESIRVLREETAVIGNRSVTFFRVEWTNAPMDGSMNTVGYDFYWPPIGAIIGAGSETTLAEDAANRDDEHQTPHSLSLPGEPGFLSDAPAPTCG